jgi:hypothetical protein
MPVIINEFEVVVEPPTSQPTSNTPPPMPAGMTPKDMERLMEHLKKRRARLHAD